MSNHCPHSYDHVNMPSELLKTFNTRSDLEREISRLAKIGFAVNFVNMPFGAVEDGASESVVPLQFDKLLREILPYSLFQLKFIIACMRNI